MCILCVGYVVSPNSFHTVSDVKSNLNHLFVTKCNKDVLPIITFRVHNDSLDGIINSLW